MTTNFKTEQEAFWAGEFGNEYIARNKSSTMTAANLAIFSEILKHTWGIESIIEFGANIGMNLKALRQLLPAATLSAIEINSNACEHLRALGYVQVVNQSILDYSPGEPSEMALIKGVLIHIDPAHLNVVYDNLYGSARRYICIAEYYSPTPVTIPYRGHSDRLFKRDFAGEMLDRYSDLKLVSYGFKYRRDSIFPDDEFNWFLLEKA